MRRMFGLEEMRALRFCGATTAEQLPVTTVQASPSIQSVGSSWVSTIVLGLNEQLVIRFFFFIELFSCEQDTLLLIFTVVRYTIVRYTITVIIYDTRMIRRLICTFFFCTIFLYFCTFFCFWTLQQTNKNKYSQY